MEIFIWIIGIIAALFAAYHVIDTFNLREKVHPLAYITTSIIFGWTLVFAIILMYAILYYIKTQRGA